MDIETVPKNAFTLLETMLAIVILALLAGAIFPLVRGGLAAADAAGRNEREEESLAALSDLLGKTFRTLPANAVVICRVEEESDVSLPRLTLERAPFALAWGEEGTSFAPVSLEVRPQANGLYSFLLSRGGKGLVLFRDVKRIGWRFLEAGSRSWRVDWSDALTHPAVIELDLDTTGAEGDRPTTLKFHLPPMTSDLVQLPSGGAS